jgi:hypothetical protein
MTDFIPILLSILIEFLKTDTSTEGKDFQKDTSERNIAAF